MKYLIRRVYIHLFFSSSFSLFPFLNSCKLRMLINTRILSVTDILSDSFSNPLS